MDCGGKPAMATLSPDAAPGAPSHAGMPPVLLCTAGKNTGAGDGTDMGIKKQPAVTDARVNWRQKPSSLDLEVPETDFETGLRREPTVMDMENASLKGQPSRLVVKTKRKTSSVTDLPRKKLKPCESLRRKQTVVMSEESMNTHREQSVLDLEMSTLNSTRADTLMSLGNEQSMMDTTNSQTYCTDAEMIYLRQGTMSNIEMQIKQEPSEAGSVVMKEATLVTDMSIKTEPSFFGAAFDSDDSMPPATLQGMTSEEKMSVRESSAPQIKLEPGVSAVEDYADCVDTPVPLWHARYSVTSGASPYPSAGSVYKQKLVVKLKNRAVSRYRPCILKGKRRPASSNVREVEAVPTSPVDAGVVIKCEPGSDSEVDLGQRTSDGSEVKPKRGRRRKSPPVCFHCQQLFCSRSSLKRHLKRKHSVKTLSFSCSFCDSKFAGLMQLRAHERWHRGGDKTFPCQECDVVFTRACHLKVHMRKHTGERPYTCSVTDCKATFRSTSNLNRHLMKHSGLRPYVCTVCDANFYQSSHLVSHVRKHTGERPFKCTQCEAAFTQLTHLQRHRVKHTGKKPYQCDLCGLGFVERCALRRHMQTHSKRLSSGTVLKIKLEKKTPPSSEEVGAQQSASSLPN